jgi:hypothetical protein
VDTVECLRANHWPRKVSVPAVVAAGSMRNTLGMAACADGVMRPDMKWMLVFAPFADVIFMSGYHTLLKSTSAVDPVMAVIRRHSPMT